MQGLTLGIWGERNRQSTAQFPSRLPTASKPGLAPSPARPQLHAGRGAKRPHTGAQCGGAGPVPGAGPRGAPWPGGPSPSLPRPGAPAPRSCPASVPEPAASRAHRAASAPCPCAARPPRAWPRPAPPRPVHCSPRAGAGQAAARRGSEPRGGAGSQGPAEERGGPDGCQRGGRAWMRREPEASSSRRRLCPRAPYGLKVSALRTERQAAGRSKGEEGARRAARLGPEVCPATLVPSAWDRPAYGQALH